MNGRAFIAAAGMCTVVAPVSQAFALRGGAILDHAVPGVGLTVTGPVREVRLYFDMGVLAANVRVMGAAGTAIPLSRTFLESPDQQVVFVRLARALPPGTYLVSWHVISVARRATWGTFRFTVS